MKQFTKEDIKNNINQIICQLEDNIDLLKKDEKSNKYQININKKILKNIKINQKMINKWIKQNPPNKKGKKSGFTKKVKISEEIALFLNLDKDLLYSRAECTKGIQNYILTNNLQEITNRRIINPDIKLANLLRYDSSQGKLYYSTIQKLIQIHFI